MARARTIKPGFFTNDLLAECDPLARLLFAGLWTIADRDGRMVCRPARIKAQVLPYDACDVDKLLAQLHHHRFIVIYEIDGIRYLQIEGFGRHQNPHPREVSEGIPEPTAESEVTESREKVLPSRVKALPSPGNAGTSNALSPLPSPLSPSPSPLSLQSLVTCDARPKRRPRSDDPLRWSEDTGWVGITDEDHARWADLFPAVDSPYELKRLDQWLRDNPAKARKSNWRRWLNKLFAGKQDKGGSSSGGAAAAPASPKPRQRDTSHIPTDCHPDDFQFFWDGNFPNEPTLYKRLDGVICSTSTRKPFDC